MLILKEIQLNNFLSHTDSKISFNENQKLLIDGKSGAGKSAIVEAIVWGLYGKGRSDNRSLITKGEKKGGVHIILIDKETKEVFKIERTADLSGKNTLVIGKKTSKGNFLPLKITGLKEKQSYIEDELLNSSYLLFINSIIYPQDNIDSFVKQTAAKKKDVILEIAKVKDYDDYYEKARVILSTLKSEVEQNDAVIESLKEQNKTNKKDADSLEEVQKEFDSLQKEKETLESSIGKIIKQLAEKNKTRDEFDTKVEKINIIKLSKEMLNSKIDESNKELVELMSLDIEKEKEKIKDLDKYREDYSKVKKDIEKSSEWDVEMLKLVQKDKPMDLGYDEDIEEISNQIITEIKAKSEGTCPAGDKCPYHNIEKQRKLNIELLNNKLEEKKRLKEQWVLAEKNYVLNVNNLGVKPIVDINVKDFLEKEIRELEIKESEVLGLEKHLVERKTKLTDVIKSNNVELKKLDEELCKIPLSDINREDLGYEIHDLTLKQNTLINSSREHNTKILDVNLRLALAQSAEKAIKENTDKIKELKKEIKNKSKKLDVFTNLKRAFGHNGIKAMVIDYIIPRLEEKINDILSKLSDFRIRLETQKTAVSGDSTIEGLFITIFNEKGLEFDFNNYSGSEKLRITYAIFEGLASIQKINFRILDELVQGMDQEVEEKFSEILLMLKDDINQIICISHLQNIKDLFDEKKEVIKLNGKSRLL